MKRLLMAWMMIIIIAVGCTHPVSLAKQYSDACLNNEFTQASLKDYIMNLERFDWKELYQCEIDNPKFISLFLKLREFQHYDEATIRKVLMLYEGHGLDGYISEEYMGLVGFLYHNKSDHIVIEKLMNENNTIKKAIEAYQLNYELPDNLELLHRSFENRIRPTQTDLTMAEFIKCVPFEWDTLYGFGAGLSNQKIMTTLDDKTFPIDMISLNHDGVICFVKEGRVVCFQEHFSLNSVEGKRCLIKITQTEKMTFRILKNERDIWSIEVY